MKNERIKAFTLIEVLVTIALIALLAVITIVAINPSKNFADSRNAQRSADVAEILSAITQYTSENGNSLAGLGTIATCPSVTTIGTGGGNVNLSAILVDAYIIAMPLDPSVGSAANTGYTACKTTTGRVTISAPNAENGKLIAVKR